MVNKYAANTGNGETVKEMIVDLEYDNVILKTEVEGKKRVHSFTLKDAIDEGLIDFTKLKKITE